MKMQPPQKTLCTRNVTLKGQTRGKKESTRNLAVHGKSSPFT